MRWRDSELLEDGIGGLAGVIAFIAGFLTFSLYVAFVLWLTVALLGHPDADGEKAWIVIGPAFPIGFGVVYAGYWAGGYLAGHALGWLLSRVRGSPSGP